MDHRGVSWLLYGQISLEWIHRWESELERKNPFYNQALQCCSISTGYSLWNAKLVSIQPPRASVTNTTWRGTCRNVLGLLSSAAIIERASMSASAIMTHRCADEPTARTRRNLKGKPINLKIRLCSLLCPFYRDRWKGQLYFEVVIEHCQGSCACMCLGLGRGSGMPIFGLALGIEKISSISFPQHKHHIVWLSEMW